jgi:hypothetical protein
MVTPSIIKIFVSAIIHYFEGLQKENFRYLEQEGKQQFAVRREQSVPAPRAEIRTRHSDFNNSERILTGGIRLLAQWLAGWRAWEQRVRPLAAAPVSASAEQTASHAQIQGYPRSHTHTHTHSHHRAAPKKLLHSAPLY